MNVVAMRLALRAAAILIAIAALIDPVWTTSRPVPRELIAVRLASTDVGDAVRSLAGGLPGWKVVTREAVGGRIPCAPEEPCVVIADGSMDADLPRDLGQPLSLVALGAAAEPNVSLRSVLASTGHASTAGTARVEVTRVGAVPRTTLEVRDGAALVGTATVEWESRSAATVDVPWWPTAAGARHLRIEAVPVDGESSAIDNAIDVGVAVISERAPVLVFDTRPSWGSTFVRRALEDDPRFAVSHRARLAPALSAGTAGGALDSRSLDAASVAMIGGPDALSAADVVLLEQFVRVRGGTLVLLPERRENGEASRLFGASWTEHLSATPESVGPLYATEILRSADASMASTVLATSGPAASIVVTPAGLGRIVVSGAMDAWRYRDRDAGAFDRFWQSLAAEGAAAGAGLQLRFERPLEARGSRARFTLRDRRMHSTDAAEAGAVVRCGSGAAKVVRLWPSGTIAEFTGEIPLSESGQCTVEATMGDSHVSASVAVADQPRRGVEATIASLSGRITDAGGNVASVADVSSVARAIAALPQAMSPVVTVYPMRAWWWLLPFAGCLSAEWWLRRRGGLR